MSCGEGASCTGDMEELGRGNHDAYDFDPPAAPPYSVRDPCREGTFSEVDARLMTATG